MNIGHEFRNLGIVQLKNKNYSDALNNFKLCQDIWEKINYQRLLGTIYNNIGDVYLRQGITEEAFDHFKKAEKMSKKVNNKESLASTFVYYAEIDIKSGNFNEAEQNLETAKRIYPLDGIENNLALIKNKIISFSTFYSFLEKNYSEVLNLEFDTITPLIKSYIIYLFEIGDIDKLQTILAKEIDFSETKDEDFYFQIHAMVACLKRDYNTAINNYKISLKYSSETLSHYSMSIINIYIANCYINLINPDKAREYLDEADRLIHKYKYSYWNMFSRIVRLKLMLLDKSVSLRAILRDSFLILGDIKNKNYFLLEIELYSIQIQIYKEMKISKLTKSCYEKNYRNLVINASKDIPTVDRERYRIIKKVNNTEKSTTHRLTIDYDFHHAFKRPNVNFCGWNKGVLELLSNDNTSRIKELLDKKIRELFTPEFYAIVLFKPNTDINLISKANSTIYFESKNEEIKKLLEDETFLTNLNFLKETKSLNHENINKFSLHKKNTIICPLILKYKHIGFFMIQDNGEMPFTPKEKSQVIGFCYHLNTLLIRTTEIDESNQKLEMLSKFMDVSASMSQIHDVNKLEETFVKNIIEITEATRGFMIKPNKHGYREFTIAYDNQGHILESNSNIAWNSVRDVSMSKQPDFTENAFVKYKDNSVYSIDKPANSWYCAPILIDGVHSTEQDGDLEETVDINTSKVYAILYLDNFGDGDSNLVVNKDIIQMFFKQANIAVRNAIINRSILLKNKEFMDIDRLKNEFIYIVSHELNTPLSNLQTNISRLKNYVQQIDEETAEIISKVDTSTDKLKEIVKSIMLLNTYNLKKSLPKEKINLKYILEDVFNIYKDEINVIDRKMNYKLEISNDLPEIDINKEAFHLLVMKLMENAVRFTADHGTITLGARKANFAHEKISNKQTVVVYVEDNGIGIPKEEIKNIFKPFYELGDIFNHKSGHWEFRSGGLGVGLAIAKKIVSLLQGKIWVKSKEKEGTTFFVAFN